MKASMCSTWALLITPMFHCVRCVCLCVVRKCPLTVRARVMWMEMQVKRTQSWQSCSNAAQEENNPNNPNHWKHQYFLINYTSPQFFSYLSEYSLYNGTEMVSSPRIAPLHQRMRGKGSTWIFLFLCICGVIVSYIIRDLNTLIPSTFFDRKPIRAMRNLPYICWQILL